MTEDTTMSDNDSALFENKKCSVVIDIGDGFIRAGFSEDDIYRSCEPAIVGVVSLCFAVIVY